MSLFGRKRRPPHEWPLQQIAEQAVASYVTDPDGDEPRGSVILHLDPELLPKDWDEITRREVEAEGEEFTGTVQWIVHKLEFVDEDRVGLYMDGDPLSVLRETYGCEGIDEAYSQAQEWVGEGGKRCSFYGLPGVFQTAFVSAVAGREIESTPADFAWIPDPEGAGEMVPMRPFPPQADREREGEGQWSLLPRAAIEELLADRPW